MGMQKMMISDPVLPEGLYLKKCDGRLCLTDGAQEVCGDFGHMKRRLREANLRQEMIVKAARIRAGRGKSDDRESGQQGRAEDIAGTVRQKPAYRVIDATAGLGEDSLLLAAAGFEVDLFERDPVIAALLEDALQRALNDPELSETVSRMHLHREDSIMAMRKCQASLKPDIVFLDPMFPERQKSALVKKKFQLLQQLESPCADETELLDAALAARPFKIIIKRPLKGPYLAGRKPSYSLTGKAIRYDCIVLPDN